MKTLFLGMLITTAVMASACNNAQPPAAGNLKEIGKKEAGGYVITLSSETGSLKLGANNLTLEFRKGEQLADPGNVEVKPMMEMKGMGPMLANTKATPSGTPGRYNITTDLSMTGPWKFMVMFSGGETEFDLATQ